MPPDTAPMARPLHSPKLKSMALKNRITKTVPAIATERTIIRFFIEFFLINNYYPLFKFLMQLQTIDLENLIFQESHP